MTRTYYRTSTRGQWTEEDLNLAAKAVEEKTGSLNQISNKFGIPLRTLLRRIKKGDFRKGSLGPTGCLGKANELKLVEYIQKLEKYGYAPTSQEIRHLAFSFAIKNKIPNKFNIIKQAAGYDWFFLFMKRHPNLRLRTAQGRSIARSLGMCHEEVDPYFKLLLDTCTQYGLLSQPRKIFNMDETGLQLNNKPGKIIATKGAKDVQTITSTEKGETISLIACCNAEGNFLPPYVVFKGKNKKKEFEDGMPPGSVVMMSPNSAYVKTDIFLSWIKDHFLPRKELGPVLLILDGHASHCSDVNVLDFIAEQQIILLCLPSHTTHWLQPLDRSFFKPLKSYWNKACTNWIRSHPGRRISRLQFGTLLNEAWGQATNVQNGVSGFEACGICPYNPNKIPEYAFTIANNQAACANMNSVPIAQSPVIQQTMNETQTMDANNSSFEDISLIPAIPGPIKISNRKQHALIVTSPEVRLDKHRKIQQKLEQQNKKKQPKQKKAESKGSGSSSRKKQGNCKKKVPETSDDSDSDDSDRNDEALYDDSSDDPNVDSDDICAICRGNYYDKKGPNVDWICCVKCKKWLHETCTSFSETCEKCLK